MKLSIVGKAVTITCSNITKKQLEKFMGNEDADVFADLHDQCKKSFIIQGVFDEEVQVTVNGEPWNGREGITELMTDFHIIGNPMRPLISEEASKNTYWFLTTEIESGSFFSLDVENFDEEKLVLCRNVYEMPNGDEYNLISATYDGKPFTYDDPENESIENSIYDSQGDQLS